MWASCSGDVQTHFSRRSHRVVVKRFDIVRSEILKRLITDQHLVTDYTQNMTSLHWVRHVIIIIIIIIIMSLSPWLSGLIRFLSHSTCWAYLAGDPQRPGIKSGSRHELSVGWTNGRYAMRLISRTGTEGPPVSSLNCDRCRLWSYNITAGYKCAYYYYYLLLLCDIMSQRDIINKQTGHALIGRGTVVAMASLTWRNYVVT